MARTRLFGYVLVGLALLGLSACAGMQTQGAPKAAAARQDVLYTCACGPECKCNSMSTKPGKCNCGKEMKWGHVLRVEGNEALLCTCDEGCNCKLDPKETNPTNCSCGKPIKRVSLKGTGIYFCNCGGSCQCDTVSDKPGKCGCGMDLKKAD
jgi:hypothetical protein